MENPTLGLAFIAGILSFISPCVLPLVPAYIGYMSGRMTRTISATAGADGQVKTNAPGGLSLRFHMLFHGIAFVLGFTIVFVALGLMTTALVSTFGSAVGFITDLIGRVGGIVIIFFGLHFMGIMPKVFAWLRKKENAGILDSTLTSIFVAVIGSAILYWAFVNPILGIIVVAGFLLLLFLGHAFSTPGKFWVGVLDRIDLALYSDTRGDMQPNGREGLLGSGFMGVVFSAGWTPCIGPLLGTILAIAAQTGEIAQGVSLLAAYSLGLGIPFIITAVLLNTAEGFLRRLQRHMHKIELISGSLLVAIGILVASGQLQSLSAQLTTGDFADFTYRVEECGIGVFEGNLHLNHVGSCLGGSLHPVPLNNSLVEELTPGIPELEVVFHAEMGEAIDIQVSRLSEGFIPVLTLLSPSGEEIVQTNSLLNAIDGKQFAVVDLVLEESGLYILLIASPDAIADGAEREFRIKVRSAEEVALADGGAGTPLVDVIATGTLGEPTEVDGSGEGDALDNIADEALNNDDMDNNDTGIGTITDLADQTDAVIGIDIGNLAPDFSVTLDTGETVTLSDLRGQVVLLNFWGTWCGPCRREMPEFQRAFEEHQDSGFMIHAVAGQDTFEAIREFREAFGLTFQLSLDEDNSIENLYGIRTRPSTYILDPDGIIVARHFGLMTETQIQEFLDEALATDG